MNYKFSANHRLSVNLRMRLGIKTAWNALKDIQVSPKATSNAFAFVVGCGHSGNTLIAARLGNMKEVFVIPRETKIFSPQNSLRDAQRIISGWDEAATERGMNWVIEKTPKHVHCWRRIRTILPFAKFIVATRNPLDTCASLKNRFGNLDLAIERYVMDNEAALELLEAGGVFHVSYENFVLNPELVGKQILEFLGLPWSNALITGGTSAYDNRGVPTNLQKPHSQKRRSQVKGPIVPRIDTWKNLISEAEAASVRRATSAVADRLGITSS